MYFILLYVFRYSYCDIDVLTSVKVKRLSIESNYYIRLIIHAGSWAIFAPLNLAPLFYTVMENDSVAVVGMTIINDVYLTFPIPVLLSFQGGNATSAL